MKGITVLSETVLTAMTIVISLILLVLIVNIVFSQQASRTVIEVYKTVGRDVAVAIDRAAALAGSGMIEQKIPKGLNMNLTIDYKSVMITYDGESVKAPFSGLLHGGPYSFINPDTLCIVKSRDDRRVSVVDRECSCDIGNGICDPACIVEGFCDPDCYTSSRDGVCNGYCVRENDNICDPDCYRNETDEIFDRDCVDVNNNPDGICDPDSDHVDDGVCDLDCFEKYNSTPGVCDPNCVPEDQNNDGLEDGFDGICYAGCDNTTKTGVITLYPDGVCDLDCNQPNNICDPDCTNDEDCEFRCAQLGESCENLPPCPDSGGVCCPGTSIVTLNCCGNGICEGRDVWEPGNKTRWETGYTCPEDCCDDVNPCPERPQDCPTRVDMGDFTSTPCYYDTDVPGGGNPYWAEDTTQVCVEDAQLFLDRRNWDINEVAKTITSQPPDGWAFDHSRYFTIITGPNSCSEQQASVTITANEEYQRSDAECCCDAARCPCAACSYKGEECCGVGFCGDHTAGILSIFRTLGVPADHIYAAFIDDQRVNAVGRHAFVVYKCDPNLKGSDPNIYLDQCDNYPSGTWLRVDATQHVIAPLSNFRCEEMCIWWNDKGPYPRTEGVYNATHGYPYPLEVDCDRTGTSDLPCKYDELCGLLGVGCVCDASGGPCTN